MTAARPDAPIAIVACAHRLPGGLVTDDAFWALLRERRIVREPIEERYGPGYAPLGAYSGPGRFASPWEGLIRDGDEWRIDRGFFGLSHDEMMQTGPIVRMLLGCAAETLERAGWSMQSMRNSETGVFLGAQVPAVANYRKLDGVDEYSVAGVSLAMYANRISYHFNLMGSSMAYCTACSAALSATHAAVTALRAGDCRQALVGSVHYLASYMQSCGFNALGVLSPEGRCRSFDADANGYLRSEGTFVFAVKPLPVAEADGDRILALIEGTAVNTAGAADGAEGLAQGRQITAPTRHSQVAVIGQACERAGIDPATFDYVEAHATGTPVGDPIEGGAIADAFGPGRREPLRIASVKSNLGHMEAAAFHCSLVKVLLMIEHRTFAPMSASYRTPNPEIDFERCPMRVQTECEPFPDRPVTIGINSFGFGGANGHCVVREYRPAGRRVWSIPTAPDGGHLIPLSARSNDALTRVAAQLREHVAKDDADLYTLAGNLGRRTTFFPVRAAFAVHDRAALLDALTAFESDPAPTGAAAEGERRIAMVFSGQGTQWARCGVDLEAANPVFAKVVDRVDAIWRRHAGWSLRDAWRTAGPEAIDECRLAQPVIFLVQAALTEVLATWGVRPDCTVGHSSGEVGAAYASGMLTLEEATALIYHRSRLQQTRAGSGRMLAIGLDRAGVETLLGTHGRGSGAEIACENAPASTVVCGREEKLRPLCEELDRRGLAHRLLPGNIAFHSTAMDPLEAPVRETLEEVLANAAFDARVPMISSVTGERLAAADAGYWWRNIRDEVRFARAMETMHREIRPDVVLEVSPHAALQSAVAQCGEGLARPPARVPTLIRGENGCTALLEALGGLFRTGVQLDFAAWYPRPAPITHRLPGYPFEETRQYDPHVDDVMYIRQGEYSHGPMAGHKVNGRTDLFEARVSARDFPYLLGHRVHHAAILPAACYLETVIEAMGGAPIRIEEAELLAPCPVAGPRRLQTELISSPAGDAVMDFRISSRTYDVDAPNEVHCRGTARRLSDGSEPPAPGHLDDLDRAAFVISMAPTGEEFYERIETVLDGQYRYSGEFRVVQELRFDPRSRAYLGDVEMDEALFESGRAQGYHFCPPQLDGALQLFLWNLIRCADILAIPCRVRGVTVLAAPTSPRLTVHTGPGEIGWFDDDDLGQFSVRPGERSCATVSIYDTDTGRLVLHIEDYRFFSSNPGWSQLDRVKHRIAWSPRDLADRPDAPGAGPHPLLAGLPVGPDAPGPLGPAPRHVRVAEIAGSRPAEETALARITAAIDGPCRDLEYWLVAADPKTSRAHFEALHETPFPVRFDHLDLDDPAAGLDDGLLRVGAVDRLILHPETARLSGLVGSPLHRLVAPGGSAVIAHADPGGDDPSTEDWTPVAHPGPHRWLRAVDRRPSGDPPGPRWIVGDGPLADAWARLAAPGPAHRIEAAAIARDPGALPDAAEVVAIDVFASPGEGNDDPVGARATWGLVSLLQSLTEWRAEGATADCRLTLVTHRAILDVADPRGQALWGAIRTVAVEIGERGRLDFRLVDVGGETDLDRFRSLAGADPREREVAIREGRILVPRLRPIDEALPTVPPGEDAPWRLCLDSPGQLSGLVPKALPERDPGPGEVEIDVAAAGLNFRDVMVALGMLPALAFERSALGHEIGMEASGRIRRAGEGVTRLRPGDEVVFIEGGCIASRLLLPEDRVFAKPPSLSPVEGATCLSAYVTAWYALVHLARLRSGQRLLVHSAMGGVGQAAMALARWRGAEIYATAGSPEKRERLLALGAVAAFDSHAESWHPELMAATGGEGVDVVLNSLAGPHLRLCLDSLRPGGWHCEIGKVDIYSGADLRLTVFRRNLRFAAIDVDRLLCDDPALARSLSEACLALLEAGDVPPLPVTTWPAHRYEDALRLMIAGKHQGKLALEIPPEGLPDDARPADLRPFLDREASYLVTGGLGGLGLCIVSYLAAAGARHLVLMDRGSERRRTAEWVRRASPLMESPLRPEIEIVAGDVACAADVRRCIAATKRPLKGVFHLAGILEDALLQEVTEESVGRTFAPKALGAWQLHEATKDLDLDHFVLFSSVAGLFGSVGQTAYTAANAYLDALAAYRRGQGLPALAFDAAGIAEAGMASRDPRLLGLMRANGLPPLGTRLAIASLDYALRRMGGHDHVIAARILDPPWTPDATDYPRTGMYLTNRAAFASEEAGELTVPDIAERLREKAAELCGHDEGGIDEPLSSFGLNSISVTELGAFIHTRFRHRVSAVELMTTASCWSLAVAIMEGGAGEAGDPSEAGEESEAPAPSAAERAEPARPCPRREPSAFALAWEDHFPAGEAPPGG